MSERTPFIRIRGLVRRYPGVIALAGCDLDIGFGEVVGLVGKNGAGKSTLIRILAGAESADEGSVSVNGATLGATHGPAAAHALGLAFMHQELANAPGLSVAENVALGSPFPRRFGVFVDNGRLEERVRAVLAELKLDIDPRAPVDGLTMVQKRMVMIARALYHNARLLVLDEPSTSLTELEIAHLHRVVRQMRVSGRSVVYVSHRLREIVDITDRVVVMQDGRVTLEKPTAAITETEIIAAIAAGATKPALSNQAARPAAKTGNPVLRVRGLSRPPFVRNVSFDLNAGEILGIAGLVGSGRTELVRLIAGADHPSSGSVELDYRIVPPGSPRKAVKAGIVLLPEDRRHQGLALSMSVRENVTLASLDRHRSSILPFVRRSSERRATVDLIRRLSIRTPGPEQEVRRLSGGNQQKTVLAKWLSRDGRVFIFDEPTQGVDVHGKDEIFALIRKVVASGKSAIVISSDFSELVSLCDRVIVLREGNIAGALEGEAIDEPTMVRLAYVDSPKRTAGMESRRT
jgi:ribose transport system ATP-binding protein